MSKLWRKGEIGALGLSTQLFLEQVEAIAQDNLSGYLRSRFMQLDLQALSPGFLAYQLSPLTSPWWSNSGHRTCLISRQQDTCRV